MPADHLADRRDRPSDRQPRRQHWVLAMTVVTVALLAAVVYVIVRWESNSTITGAVVSYDLPHDGVMPVTVEIVRDADVAIECDLVAVDDRQIIVGQSTLEVPAGPETRLRADTEIPLEGDGIVAKLRGCQAG